MAYELPISKMHGIGNSYAVIDDLKGDLEKDFGYDLIGRALSDKSFGAGSDGVLVVRRGNAAPYWMRVLNPDGSEAEMCGNGIRMFARYLWDTYMQRNAESEVEVGGLHGGRIVKPKLNFDQRGAVQSVTVDMGVGEFIERPKAVYVPESGTFMGNHVSVGNPHFVAFALDRSEASYYAKNFGSVLENHQDFRPARTNVEFAYAPNKKELYVYVWERGAGPTLACGTGACASQFAAYKDERTDSKAVVHLPGGDLDVSVSPNDRITMTGPAEYIFFRGKIPDFERFLSTYQDFEKRDQ